MNWWWMPFMAMLQSADAGDRRENAAVAVSQEDTSKRPRAKTKRKAAKAKRTAAKKSARRKDAPRPGRPRNADSSVEFIPNLQ